MPKTNQPEDLSARDAASQPEEQPQADAPAEEKKPDLFDYLESQPDVEDRFRLPSRNRNRRSPRIPSCWPDISAHARHRAS